MREQMRRSGTKINSTEKKLNSFASEAAAAADGFLVS